MKLLILLFFTFGILWHTAECEIWIPVPINPMSNDFVIGYQTESSVLVHTRHLIVDPTENEIVLDTIEWFGNHIIRKVEAIDQDDKNGGHVYQFAGGISETKIQLSFRSSTEGYGINFIISVYGEPQPPNDFDYGNLTPRSRLVHNNILEADGIPNSLVLKPYIYSSIIPISAFKVRDLNTDGFGGQMIGYNNDFKNITIDFQSTSLGHGFRFNVYFYVEPIDGNDFFMGYLTPGSVLAKLEYVRVINVEPNEIAKELVSYQGTRVIRRIAAYDQNIYGTGGFVSQIISGGIGETSVTIEFSASEPGGTISFNLEIFIEGENNFVIGKLQINSVLISRQEIYIPAIANQNQNTIFTFDVTTYGASHLMYHIIGKVEALDMTFDGTGGIVELLSGGINHTEIELSLRTSSIGQPIHFFVVIYGNSKVTDYDFMIGEIKPTSILTHKSSLEIDDLIGKSGSKSFGSISFPRRTNQAIQFIQGFDLTDNGSGGRFVELQFKNESTKFDVLFESIKVSGPIKFLVEVYYG